MTEHTELDALIDRYLDSERRDRPRIGYPSKAAGTSLFRASRQWEAQTLEETISSGELSAMEGAWASLTITQDRLLRTDALHRERDYHPADTSEIDSAKARLRRLLGDRGIFV